MLDVDAFCMGIEFGLMFVFVFAAGFVELILPFAGFGIELLVYVVDLDLLVLEPGSLYNDLFIFGFAILVLVLSIVFSDTLVNGFRT